MSWSSLFCFPVCSMLCCRHSYFFFKPIASSRRCLFQAFFYFNVRSFSVNLSCFHCNGFHFRGFALLMETSNKSFFSCRKLKISQMIQTDTTCYKTVLGDTQRCQITCNSRDCGIWKKVLRSYTTNYSSFGFNKKSDYFQPKEKFLRGNSSVLCLS